MKKCSRCKINPSRNQHPQGLCEECFWHCFVCGVLIKRDRTDPYCKPCRYTMWAASQNKPSTYGEPKFCGSCSIEYIPTSNNQKSCSNCGPERRRLKNNAAGAQRRHKLRREVIQGYGGKCSCCGENEYAFLELDHINNDGHVHKMIGLVSGKLHKYVKDNGYPPVLQVLCGNCHRAKTSFGKCPHQGDMYEW